MTVTAQAPAASTADPPPDALNALTGRLRHGSHATTSKSSRSPASARPASPLRRSRTQPSESTSRSRTPTDAASAAPRPWACPSACTPTGEQDMNLPPALWAFLTAAVAAHGQPADRDPRRN